MANAIEMAVKAAMMKMIGPFLENLPPEVMQTIGQIGETVSSFQATLERIEHQNAAIMVALNIPQQKEMTENERDTGSDERAGPAGTSG